YRVIGNVVDRLPALPDLMADGGFDLKLTAGLEPERDVVEDAAGDPSAVGDARDSGESHPRRAAHHVENGGHGVDLPDGIDIRLIVAFQIRTSNEDVAETLHTSCGTRQPPAPCFRPSIMRQRRIGRNWQR